MHSGIRIDTVQQTIHQVNIYFGSTCQRPQATLRPARPVHQGAAGLTPAKELRHSVASALCSECRGEGRIPPRGEGGDWLICETCDGTGRAA